MTAHRTIPATVTLVALALSGCSPPHQFNIRSDKPMQAVEVSFANAPKATARLVSPYYATAEIDVSDSSGEFRISMVEGDRVVCSIGYITNGEQEPHNLNVRNGRCSGF